MNAKLSRRDISIGAHGVESFSSDHQANETFFKFAKKQVFEIFQPIRSRIPWKVSIDWWLNTIRNHSDLGPGALYDGPLDGLKAVAGYDKRIGFCADLGHYIRSGVDRWVVYQLGDRLYGIHQGLRRAEKHQGCDSGKRSFGLERCIQGPQEKWLSGRWCPFTGV